MHINRLRIFILGFILSVLLLFLQPQRVFAEIINGSWSNTINLTNQIASHVSTSEGGRLFIFGGANNDDFSNVESSLIDFNGSLSAWTIISNLPETRYWAALAKKEKRFYILGGAMWTGITNYKNTVYSATIQLDGSISSWQSLVSLPGNRALGGAVVVGDKIYYAGGRLNDAVTEDEVYVADINPDGTIGGWRLAGLLPESLYGFGMVEYNNNLIIVGGYTGSVYRDKTYRASVNPDGTISAFVETSALPEAIYRSGVIRIGSTLISAGGLNDSSYLDKVYYTDINLDGTLDSWQQSANSLPQPVHAGALSFSNGYLYFTGGFNGSYLNNAYYVPVNISVGVDLAVPLLKQTDPLWGTQIYNSANTWAPSSPGISSWGCALTSAAMVFQYHGITKLPDNSTLDPGTLNSWLKSQPDGYVRNGLVNWLTLTRLSRLSKPNNPSFASNALKYRRVNGEDKTQLTSDLGNGIPGILEEPDHFIVGKGTSGDTFLINDPFYNRFALNDGYSNTFLSLGRFIPSNTDLSYVMGVVDSNVNVLLLDSEGNIVGESFIQESLENDEGAGKSGQNLRTFYLAAPDSGQYSLALSSSITTKYNLDLYAYDKDGNVKVAHFNGVVGPEDSDQYSIKFNKEDSKSSLSNQNITFDSLINDLDSLYSLREINFGYHLYLLIQANTAKFFASNQFTKGRALALLRSMDKQILEGRGRGISDSAYDILHNDIQHLILNLTSQPSY